MLTSLFKYDNFEPLEYDPLINPRAHNLSSKSENILNKNFRETYLNFLKYCASKPTFSSRDRVIFTCYLLL